MEATWSPCSCPVTRSPDSSTCNTALSRHSAFTAAVDGSINADNSSEAFNTVASLIRCGTTSAHIAVVRSTGIWGSLVQYDAQVCTVGPYGTAGVTVAGKVPGLGLPQAGQTLISA